jgi:putative hydrolase of HD superfamily
MPSSKKPNLDRIISLQEFFIAFGDIERVIHLKTSSGHVKENDIEHSYSLAMTGWFLSQAFPHLNSSKIIRYALVHDIVEVYAGDTYVFADQSELNSKKAREAEALKRIRKEWRDFSEMLEAIDSYESMSDEESKFVYALDKIMPIILNVVSKGHTWHKEGISLRQLHDVKKDKVKVSAEISQYYDEIYGLLQKNPTWFPKRGKE